MKSIWNSDKKEAKLLMQREQEEDSAMSWQSHQMHPAASLWETLALVSNRIGRMLTDKIRYLGLFSIKIEVWWVLFKVRLKLGKLNRQKTKSGRQ